VAVSERSIGLAGSNQPPGSHTFVESLTERLSGIGQAFLALGQNHGRFREVLEALPAAIYTTDAAGRIAFYNEAAATMWGRRPELGDEQWCGSWKLYWPDGTALAHDECPMAIALKTGRPVRGMEAVAERPDGTRIPFAPHPTPIFDASGELVGAVNMLVDLTHRKQLEEDAQRLASIVQSSDDAIVGKDLNSIINSWNRGAERLFGYAAEEVIGKPITILFPADLADEEPAILERLRRGERIDHHETVRQRKDGSLVDISLTVSPILSADGRVIGVSKIARDITDGKRAQEQQRLLLAEIMHRVKNTLTTIQAIAAQTLRRAPADEREAFTTRLHALSKAHDLLTSDTWDRASLRAVLMAALEPFPQQRFVLDGPDVSLNASKSLQMTLAVHELATNAVKYGALSTAAGRVHLAWELADDQRLKLRWAEDGGPPVTPPKQKGFGTILIEHTFERARLDYGPLGFESAFEIAL